MLALLVFAVLSAGEEPKLPPPAMDLKEEWETLEKKGYAGWQIRDFVLWSGVADGGSMAFEFLTDGGVEFDVLVANPGYWTVEDKKAKRQVIYLIESGRFYLLVPESDQEKKLLQMLGKVRERLKADGETPKWILDALMETIEIRTPVGDGWPLDGKKAHFKDSGGGER